MPYERLLKQDLIKRQSPGKRAVQDLLTLADRDAHTAEHLLEMDPDWAFNIAYNSALQVSRAYMLQEGYRPRGPNQHATVIQFLKEGLAELFVDDITTLDQMRRKRHRSVYETAGRIGVAEAEQAVAFAKRYLARIRGLLG